MTQFLPLFLLLTAGLGVWFSRRQAIRTQWIISAVLALSAWVASLMLRLGQNTKVEFPIWQPMGVLPQPLSFSLDAISWPVMYSVVTVLLAMILTAASRKAMPRSGIRIFWFLYTAVTLSSILADNYLTIILTWTLFDFLSALFLFRTLETADETKQVITRLSIDTFGLLLVLAGSAVSIAAGESVSLAEPIRSPVAGILLAAGSLVRLGLFPLHFSIPTLLATRRGLGTLLRLFPPAVVLTFLARLFHAGFPSETLPWLYIAALSGIILGGLRWIFEKDTISGRPYFILTLSGVGVLSAASVPGESIGLVSIIVILLLAGAVISLAVIHTPSHRVFAIGAGVVLLGIPFLPGSALTHLAFNSIEPAWPGLIWVIFIVLGTVAATLGSLHMFFAEEAPWHTGESMVRLTYGLGLSLPVLTSIGLGIHFQSPLGLWTWLTPVIQVVLVLGGMMLLRNLPGQLIQRLSSGLSMIELNSLYRGVGRGLEMALNAIQTVADFIEGEAAILWVFAIAVFLVLASR